MRPNKLLVALLATVFFAASCGAKPQIATKRSTVAPSSEDAVAAPAPGHDDSDFVAPVNSAKTANDGAAVEPVDAVAPASAAKPDPVSPAAQPAPVPEPTPITKPELPASKLDWDAKTLVGTPAKVLIPAD